MIVTFFLNLGTFFHKLFWQTLISLSTPRLPRLIRVEASNTAGRVP
jgi:hypothetical protein